MGRYRKSSSAPLNLSLCPKAVRHIWYLPLDQTFYCGSFLPSSHFHLLKWSQVPQRGISPRRELQRGSRVVTFFNLICMCFWFLSLPKLIINNVKCASWFDRDHSMQWQCHQLWPWMPHDRWRVCVRLSWGIFTTGQWRRLHWYGL